MDVRVLDFLLESPEAFLPAGATASSSSAWGLGSWIWRLAIFVGLLGVGVYFLAGLFFRLAKRS